MFRSALLILSGNAFGSLMMFARSLLVARLISPEDYGIAVTFAISMAIVEMASAFGLQQLIVQDTNGNDPKMQSGLQGFHLMRGALSASALFLLAHPIANFLNIPHLAWAYQLLAPVPLLNGLMHFDIYRLQRKMNFRPSILCITVPAILALLIVYPLFKIFGDFRVMLFAIFVQHLSTVIGSHLVAERKYKLSIDRAVIAKSIIFGWPLLINNFLMFGVFQGDKVIVGREFSLETLAIFAMGFTLTLTPTLIMARSAQSFFLPQLSAVKDTEKPFQDLAMATIQCHLVFAAVLVICIKVLGGPFIHLVLGEKYEGVIPILVWLAIMQAIRVARNGSSTSALARGHTQNAMIANLIRVCALPVAWYVAAVKQDIILMIWVGIFAELISALVSLALLSKRSNVTLKSIIVPSLLILLFLTVSALQAQGPHGLALLSQPWGIAVPIAVFLLSLATMKELKQYIRNRTMELM